PGRTRDVEQDEHGEVAPEALAFDVHRLVGWRAGEGFDTRFDDCIDVDVIALQLPATALELHAEAGEPPTQGAGGRRYGRRHVPWPGYGLDDRAPVGPVASPVQVPFGVRGAALLDDRDGVGHRRVSGRERNGPPNACPR